MSKFRNLLVSKAGKCDDLSKYVAMAKRKYPELSDIIDEWNPVVHNLVQTDKIL